MNADAIIDRTVEVKIIKGGEPNVMSAESSGGKLPTVRSVQSVTHHKKELLGLINRLT